LQLKDGSKVAVIGGGPTGAFFSIFALKMAKMIDLGLNVTTCAGYNHHLQRIL